MSKQTPDGDPDCWNTLQTLGFTTLRSADDDGNHGSTTDALIVLEEMGRSLCGASVITRAILVPELLKLSGLRDPEVLSLHQQGRLGLMFSDDLRQLDGYAQTGAAWDAHTATHALRLARGQLQVAELGEPDLLADRTRSERRPCGSPRRLDSWIDEKTYEGFAALARLCVCADALGAASAVFELAVDYAKARTQYGRPIGSFQAVQHLLADSYWRLDALRSAVLYGAWTLDNGELNDAVEVAAAAKQFGAEATLAVAQSAIQVFGGIAITWEHPAHLYLRRVMVDDAVLADGPPAMPTPDREETDELRG